MSPARRGRMEPLGSLVPRVLRDLGLDGSAFVLQVAERWEEAVGAEIARQARPRALRGQTLEVSVASSVWCQELQLRIPEMLAGLGRVWGARAPTALRLRVAARER